MSKHAIDISTDADRQKAAQWCGKAPKGMRIEFRTPTRSVEQNKMMWALINELREAMAARGRVHTAEHWKIILLHACGKELSLLPSLDGATVIPYGQSSSELTIKEMTDLIEFIQCWCAENGIQVKSAENAELKKHLVDFSRKGLATIRELNEGDAEASIDMMVKAYMEEFGDDITSHLQEVMATLAEVNSKNLAEREAINRISKTLGCRADELKGVRS